MRQYIDIVNEAEAAEGQYLLATYNLDNKSWRVTFYPNRTEAFEAYKTWSSAFNGDAYIAPVERKFYGKRHSEKSTGEQ